MWRKRGRSSLWWMGLQGETPEVGGIGNNRVRAEVPRAGRLDQPYLGTLE